MNAFAGLYRKGCRQRGCLIACVCLIVLYSVWSVWTGWLGADRVDTWGVSIPGMVAYGLTEGRGFEQTLAKGPQARLDLLERPIPKSLLRPSVGADKPEVVAGELLPLEFDRDTYRKYYQENEFETLVSGDFIVRNFREWGYMNRFRLLASQLWEDESVGFVMWLEKQSEVLPPRRLDTLVFFHTGWEVGGYQSPEFWRKTYDLWRRMSEAKNPYYRLRAVELAQYWARDWAEEKSVYLNALNEKEPGLSKSARYRLEARGKLEGR